MVLDALLLPFRQVIDLQKKKAANGMSLAAFKLASGGLGSIER
jgi:hypothetical protein